MKTLMSMIGAMLLCTYAYGRPPAKLYPVTDGQKWGYIDTSGALAIPLQYYAAGHFNNGLAPVRLKGSYGYINANGDVAIHPRFDYALAFQKGLAKVYIDGRAFFISTKGDILFEHPFKEIDEFGDRTYARAVTVSGRMGLVDRSGRLLADTVFKEIQPFSDGVALVTGLLDEPRPREEGKAYIVERGAIDSSGNWVVKYGRYEEISNFMGGYAEATVRGDGNPATREKEVIDKSGRVRFSIPLRKWYINGGFHCGLAAITIYRVDLDTVRGWMHDQYTCRGIIDATGKLIASDTTWNDIVLFSFTRAFVRSSRDGKWSLININDKKVTAHEFHDVFNRFIHEPSGRAVEGSVNDGRAFVLAPNGIGTIDTTGEFVIQPKTFGFRFDQLYPGRDIVLLKENKSRLYGFWDIRTGHTVKPAFSKIDMSAAHDLIPVVVDGQSGYVNMRGKVVWTAPKEEHRDSVLDIDFMNMSYYHASSEYVMEWFGGSGKSDNTAKQLSADIPAEGKKLQMILDPSKPAQWSVRSRKANLYKGITLYAVNSSADTMYFNAQDGRLYLTMQAQDKHGQWKDIEYILNSWCGNSAQTIYLAPGQYWEFPTPLYQGEFTTRLRAKLIYQTHINWSADGQKPEKKVLYSNEIEGQINPGQLWRDDTSGPQLPADPHTW